MTDEPKKPSWAPQITRRDLPSDCFGGDWAEDIPADPMDLPANPLDKRAKRTSEPGP